MTLEVRTLTHVCVYIFPAQSARKLCAVLYRQERNSAASFPGHVRALPYRFLPMARASEYFYTFLRSRVSSRGQG